MKDSRRGKASVPVERGPDPVVHLHNITELHAAGLLTDEEFELKRAAAIAQL